MTEDPAAFSPVPRWRLRPASWQGARNGDPARINGIFAKTIERARAKGLIPLAVGFGMNDAGRSMMVLNKANGVAFNVSYIYAPSRDGYFGFYAMPPTVLKDALRAFNVRKAGDPVQ